MARSNNMTLPREDFAEAATLAEGAEESPPFYLYGQVLDDVSFVQDRYERARNDAPFPGPWDHRRNNGERAIVGRNNRILHVGAVCPTHGLSISP
jgi:hypothetical protein